MKVGRLRFGCKFLRVRHPSELSVRDFLLSTMELSAAGSILMSFFDLNTIQDERTGEFLCLEGGCDIVFLVEWMLLSMAVCGLLVFFVPRLCCRRLPSILLSKDTFPAALQVIKLGMLGYLGWRIQSSQFIALKSGEDMSSALILGTCEVVGMLGTIVSIKNNGKEDRKLELVLAFADFWKLVGVVTSFVQAPELTLLIYELPAASIGALTVWKHRITPEQAKYHGIRVFFVVCMALGLVVNPPALTESLGISIVLVATDVVASITTVREATLKAATEENLKPTVAGSPVQTPTIGLV